MRFSRLRMALAIAAMFGAVRISAAEPWSDQSSGDSAEVAYDYTSYYDEGEAPQEAGSPSDPVASAPAQDYTYRPSGSCCAPSCDTGDSSCCRTGGCGCGGEEEGPWSLFDLPILSDNGIVFGGFVSGGIVTNFDDPADKFNGPVTFTDREGEAQLNQLYMNFYRNADTSDNPIAIGGRVDSLYGSDWRFTPALGLETNVDGTMDWNQSQRFYGLALPQMYAEVGINDLNVKAGHFYTIIGYEVVPAIGNFFTTHAYTMQYGEPFTHTGVLSSFAITENMTIYNGLHRGWDQWQDLNDELGYLGGVTWNFTDTSTLAFALSVSDEDIAGNATRYIHSIVYTQKMGDALTYVFQSDIGHQEGAAGLTPGGADAEWYGVNQYLFYTVDDNWTAGLRAEWFRDDDGFRVAGFGSVPGDFAFRGFPGSGFAGNFYEMSGGLNRKIGTNMLMRTECRWDWYDGADGVSLNPLNGGRPYDDGSDSSQFMWVNNFVMQF